MFRNFKTDDINFSDLIKRQSQYCVENNIEDKSTPKIKQLVIAKEKIYRKYRRCNFDKCK